MAKAKIDFDDMDYAAPLRQFDLRTAPERMADEIATLRGDLAKVSATVLELNRRMAVVENRLAVPATPVQRSAAAVAIAKFMRRQGINDTRQQADQLRIATPNAVAETLYDAGDGLHSVADVAEAMRDWLEVTE